MSYDDAMKEAPGAKQARYKKPEITKASSLKEFRK
jgi:hypothetical protein